MKNLPILIIDDDPIFAKALSLLLSKYAFKITIANSAEIGYHFVSELKPDIIFLDNILPHIQGAEVIEMYKKTSPNSKIILISSNFTVEDIALAIQNHADYILEKRKINPAKMDDLINAIIKSKEKDESIWRILKIFEKPKKNIRNIVVIEDDELFSFHLCWSLNELAGNLKVTSYSKGVSFIEDLKRLKPDLIFLDYTLPDISCLEILTQIKLIRPKTKVIIISAQENALVANKLNTLGIYGYIVKNGEWKIKLNDYINKLGL